MPKIKKNKIKTIIINISVLLLTILLFILFIEGSLRLFMPQNLKFVEPDEYYMYKPIPHIEQKYTRQEFQTQIKINSKGIRDFEYDYIKPNNTFRILVLGDSFIMGNFLELNQTFSKLLEKKLNKNSNINFEVISGSCIGWGTNSELIYLKKEGIKYNPDLIILAFFHNDYGNNIMKDLFLIKNNTLIDNTPIKISKFKKYLYKCASFSHLCSLLEKVISENPSLLGLLSKFKVSNRNETKEKFDYDIDLFNNEPDKRTLKMINKTILLINRMDLISKQINSKFFVLSIPYKYQIDNNLKKNFILDNNLDKNKINIELPQIYLNNYLIRSNIPYLDLLLYYKRLNKDNSFYWKIDGHWNQLGVNVAVDLTYAKLKTENLLPFSG